MPVIIPHEEQLSVWEFVCDRIIRIACKQMQKEIAAKMLEVSQQTGYSTASTSDLAKLFHAFITKTRKLTLEDIVDGDAPHLNSYLYQMWLGRQKNVAPLPPQCNIAVINIIDSWFPFMTEEYHRIEHYKPRVWSGPIAIDPTHGVVGPTAPVFDVGPTGNASPPGGGIVVSLPDDGGSSMARPPGGGEEDDIHYPGQMGNGEEEPSSDNGDFPPWPPPPPPGYESGDEDIEEDIEEEFPWPIVAAIGAGVVLILLLKK